MSHHNRERRRAGVLKTRGHVETPGESRRANEQHRTNLVLYRKLRVAQDVANEFQAHATFEHDGQAHTVRPYPQHYTEKW